MFLQYDMQICMTIMLTILSAEINTSSSDEIQEIKHNDFGNSIVSTPKECQRACQDGEPPKLCYYHFTLENYNVLGAACQFCNGTSDFVSNDCQCVVADGVQRSILTANRMIPGPSIQVCEGDVVVIDVENQMSGMGTAIHWHGVFQNGFQYYDGVPHVTQCAIDESTTFRYKWTAANAGTHFWHSHSGLQEIDGLYGSLVIRQPPSKDLSRSLYDYDLSSHIVLISDWMHESGEEKFPGLLNDVGQTPVSLLINGRGQYADPDTGSITNTSLAVFTIKSGKRYRFRLINAFGTVCPAEISFQDHQLIIIATDGNDVEPVAVNTIRSASGERYDFVITADQPVDAYWIQLRGLGECGEDKRIQNLGILRYERGPGEPNSPKPTYDDGLARGILLNPVDGKCNETRADNICVNQLRSAEEVDKGILQEKADVVIYLPFGHAPYKLEDLFEPNTYKSYLVTYTNRHTILFIDGISFVFPPAPPLSQPDDMDPNQFCNSHNTPADCDAICTCTHTINIPLNAIVEVVLVDEASEGDWSNCLKAIGSIGRRLLIQLSEAYWSDYVTHTVHIKKVAHPFHLHGHAFYVIGMGRATENITKMDVSYAIEVDKRRLMNGIHDRPPLKDTIAVPENGYTIFRFRANNPGYWLFHCHFLYHMTVGMNVIFHVGNEADLPPVPVNFPKCGNFL